MSTLYEVSSLITLVMNKPNMFAQVLGVLNKGTQIDVISISGAWAYFKYNNVNAYVKKGNLKILDSELIQVKGSITLKYLDSSTNNEIYSSETINNLELGSYSYEAKIIYGYKLQNDSTQSVNLTTESPNQVITFYYNQVLGSIIIKYVDITTNTDIYESKTIENLSLGTYTYGSINISAYMLSDDKTKTVTITESSPSETITFKYTKILGTVTVKYIDNSSSTELLPADTFTDLKLGNYSYNSKDISGYTITNDSTQTIELTDDNYNIEIEFKYNKLFGSVTIKYLDSSSLKEIDSATVISNLSLGTYSYTAKSFEGYEVIGESSTSTTLTTTEPNQTISFKYNKVEAIIPDASIAYKVPYISTYYFNTKPTIYEDFIIPFYVTNYEQSEYLYDEEVELDVLYQMDEDLEKVITVYAGDNSINLGKLSKGEHYFSLQALDKSTNLKSHKLYNEVLVIDNSYTITKEQTYTITDDDLSKYSITKVDTTDEDKMTNNRIGLTKLFADLQSQGYRRCILPFNSYFRIKKVSGTEFEVRNGAIQIPSNFTVDMNGSTFKLETNTEDINNINKVVDLLVRMNNCYDSHLINGILEGDRIERKALGLETGYKGEPISTIQFVGCKYSSLENLLIKQTTGHTVISAFGKGAGNILIPNTTFEKLLIYNDKILETDLWSTSQFINISDFTMNYLTVGRYLGYRGVIGKSLIVYYNFYDENYNFIKMIVGYQYRKTLIPTNSKFIRISLYGDLSNDTNVSIFYHELGTNLEIKNINFEDTRTCAIATTTSNGLLIDNVKFSRCGQSITPSPVDFEDGWQECQDVYFKNCVNNESSGIIDNAGYNHVYENNNELGYIIRYSLVGLVIRNNYMGDSRWAMGYETGSKFSRIINNTINGRFTTSIVDDNKAPIVNSLIKDSIINCKSLNYLECNPKYFAYKNCIISNFNAKNIKAIDCTLHPSPYLWNGLTFDNCIFFNFNDINSIIKFSFNALNTVRLFNNCNFKSPTQLVAHNNFNNGQFINCIFEKTVSISPNQSNNLGDLTFNNCIFKGDISINILNINCFIEFIGCQFEGNKKFQSYGKSNSIFR